MADDRRKRPQRPPPPPDLGNREQVRRLKRAMNREATEVIRCQQCGNQQSAQAALITRATTCHKCGTAIHSCKHCRWFDSRARHQCAKPIDTPVADKWTANTCPIFEPRLVLDATGKRAVGGKGKKDAKDIFDSLFKD